MPKKFTGQNMKAVQAKERKEHAKEEKDHILMKAKELQETLEWSEGARKTAKYEMERQKKLEKSQERAKLEQQLQEETADVKTSKSAKIMNKKDKDVNIGADAFLPLDHFAASNIDDALDIMTSMTGKQGMFGDVSNNAERHPEKRMKAAYIAFEDEKMRLYKMENPNFRYSQLKEMIYKEWQKSSKNPMNQLAISYNMRAEEERIIVKESMESKLERLRVE